MEELVSIVHTPQRKALLPIILGLGGRLCRQAPAFRICPLLGGPPAVGQLHLADHQVSVEHIGLLQQPQHTSPRMLRVSSNTGDEDWQTKTSSAVKMKKPVAWTGGLPFRLKKIDFLIPTVSED